MPTCRLVLHKPDGSTATADLRLRRVPQRTGLLAATMVYELSFRSSEAISTDLRYRGVLLASGQPFSTFVARDDKAYIKEFFERFRRQLEEQGFAVEGYSVP